MATIHEDDYKGPERRENLTMDMVENRLRRVISEEIDKLRVDIYDRAFQPLRERVEKQDEFCQMHTNSLTHIQTLVDEMVDAKLIRRLEVAEARLYLIGRATVVIGTLSGTALTGLILGIMTHSIKL